MVPFRGRGAPGAFIMRCPPLPRAKPLWDVRRQGELRALGLCLMEPSRIQAPLADLPRPGSGRHHPEQAIRVRGVLERPGIDSGIERPAGDT